MEEKEKAVIQSITIKPSKLDYIKQAAEKLDVTFSQFVREAAMERARKVLNSEKPAEA